ncbi:MAG TPA: PAS domain S-box protein, partial [Anaerolineales bacterium]|nr:PAS domain S-box protein [Anaerolineales bacterium]
VIVGYVATVWLIVEPRQVITLNSQNVTGLALFLFSNTVVMALGETMRRAQRHAHQSAGVAIERQHQVETQLLEKQRAEEALRRNEQMFSTLVDAAPFGVYFIDSEFRLRAINKGSEAVFSGIHPLIGRDFAEIVGIIWPEPFASEAIERFRHTLRTGESFISPTIVEQRSNIEEIEAYDWQIHRITLSDGTYGVVCYFYDLSEQKRLEATVRASEALYRTIARSIPGGGIYVVDKEFRYLVAEGPVTDAFGLSREMLEGHTVSEVFPPEPSGRMVERLKRNFAGETVSFETNHNGRVYWTQQAPLQDSLGNAIIVTLDITERKQAEEALRQSEERFARFMQYLPGLAWIKDMHGRYVYANAAAEKAFNTPLEKLYGNTDEDIFPAEVAAQFSRNDELALTDEKGIQVAETFEHPDGVLHYSLVNKFPILGPDGSTAMIGGTAFDITERKQAEEALRESEERFRALLRQATAGIVRKDAEGKFIFVNEAFCNMLGYDEAELLGKTAWQFTHADDLEENKRLFERAMMEGIPFKLEKRLLRKDGSILWVDVSVSPIMDAAGAPQSAVAIEVDITRRKEVEETLHQLNLQLESRVQKRTVELQTVNESLRAEIAERLKVEDALHESRKRLQLLSQRLVHVQEEERRAIARELHDRVGQSLSALNINLVILDNQISSHVPEEISARLDDSMELVAETITLVRDVMSDLRPSVLDDYGLEAALQSHVNAFRSRYSIEVQYEKSDQPIPRLGASIEMTILRIAQEALMNVARHARAEKVTVSIR